VSHIGDDIARVQLFPLSAEHQRSSGRIHGCHRCDPGSIPGCCILFLHRPAFLTTTASGNSTCVSYVVPWRHGVCVCVHPPCRRQGRPELTGPCRVPRRPSQHTPGVLGSALPLCALARSHRRRPARTAVGGSGRGSPPVGGGCGQAAALAAAGSCTCSCHFPHPSGGEVWCASMCLGGASGLLHSGRGRRMNV
jgi:hypothetical protein